MRMKWSERPRAHRCAVVGAFVGMAIAAAAVFEYAADGTIVDRYLIVSAGLLGGGGAGALLARMTAR